MFHYTGPLGKPSEDVQHLHLVFSFGLLSFHLQLTNINKKKKIQFQRGNLKKLNKSIKVRKRIPLPPKLDPSKEPPKNDSNMSKGSWEETPPPIPSFSTSSPY
jgi:hypothetical protein